MVAHSLLVVFLLVGAVLIFAANSGIAWALYPFLERCPRRGISGHLRILSRRRRRIGPRWSNRRRRPGGTVHSQKERFRLSEQRHRFLSPAGRCGTEGQLDAVVFYDKPILKFARLLETYLAVAPGGWRTFPGGVHLAWRETESAQGDQGGTAGTGPLPDPLHRHHEAHAASAFYPSPFTEAAILTIDGVGEWATTTIGQGEGNEIKTAEGAAISAFTGLALFRVYLLLRISYQLRRIQAHGPGAVWRTQICRCDPGELIDLKADGSFRLNLEYFNFLQARP